MARVIDIMGLPLDEQMEYLSQILPDPGLYRRIVSGENPLGDVVLSNSPVEELEAEQQNDAIVRAEIAERSEDDNAR